ncbi:MAG TPA: choice-of-anchor Q domain-containing protein, partial [Acidobacteriaceae bacterium]|nr:choice-of-anchor Q domain-containing protein [Acidobacteriaceae bacterium]
MPSTRCSRFSPSFILRAMIAGLLPFSLTLAACAATVVVNTTADSNDGLGSCARGTCSLRDAISQSSAGDTIAFASGVTGTITLSGELPNITQDLIIQGPGASVLTISGAKAYRVFTVYPQVGTATVTISGLTLANGSDSVEGGALSIYQRSTVTVDRVVFDSNTSPSGGAIVNDGALTVTGSTFRNNSAGPTGYGGGISTYTPLTVISSTFYGNYADIGAAIYNSNSVVAVLNSTFAYNANAWIGSVHNNSGTLTVSDSTFVANTGTYSGGGGGLANNAGTLTVTNTILDRATACYANGTGCPAATDPSTGNVVGGKLNLAPLAFYGGPAPTMLPLPGSNAICAGVASDVPAAANDTDERGFPVNASCVDAGADQTNYLQVTTAADSNDGPCSGSGPCSLRDAIGTSTFEDIDFASSLNGSTITLGSELPAIAGNTTIIGPGANQLSISGANASRAFYVSTGSLSLYGLTLTNGNAAGYSDGTGGFGGAVFNSGMLAVNNVQFTGNSAGTTTGAEGGAIYNDSGTILGLTDSTFSNNTAGKGSALFNSSVAPLSISYSTFSGNVAGDAGAVYNGSSGKLSMISSTFAGNTASGTGGVGSGIVNNGSFTATNSLIQDDSTGAECSTSTSSACPANGDGHGNVVLGSAASNGVS